MKLFVLFSMFFLHIVDDYYLQGILAKMKQKSGGKKTLLVKSTNMIISWRWLCTPLVGHF